ncbi:MAG: S1 RNA-binding domain-containing protein [Herpetosiphonaceae bacterium]|nr:S1 RNA-binding domain-containing protein [Herpetosiphonaceae bacterium]
MAKDVAGVVVDKAKDVTGVVTDHAPAVVATVSDTAAQAVEKIQTLVGGSSDEPVTAAAQNGGPSTETPAPQNGAAESTEPSASEPQSSGVIAAVANTASSAADTVTGAAQAVADKASDATTAARRTLSRIYSSVTGEQGASYQPPAESPKGGRPRRFKDVSPGMQLEGKVTSIALYGIFVDVGVGRDGLVHISEMSDKRIEAPTDLVQIGTPVTVWVKSVDADARRISLTMRDPNRPKPERTERRPPRKPEVNREKLASLKPGDTVEGVISSLAPFGAFVDIGAGKDGLVHISELAEGRVEKPEDAVTIGERYPFRVLEVDPEGNRISLSLRRAQRANKMQQLESGTQLEGTISGLAAFGAFVDIGVGRDGLVHVSELSSERVNKVEDVVKVGDKVQVKILEVDPNSKRISLTMRVDEPPPAERPKPQGRPGGFSGESTPSFGGPSNFSGGSGYSSDRGPSNFSGGFVAPRPDMTPDSGASRGGAPRTRGGSSRNDSRDRTDRFDDRPGAAPRRGNDRNDRGGDRPAGGRGGPGGGSRAGGGRGQVSDQTQEVYTFEDPEEESFTGDASLQDLLSKFNSGKGRDSKRTRDDEEMTDEQRRNDAIQRTLALRDEE